jgi:hypothetical protein
MFYKNLEIVLIRFGTIAVQLVRRMCTASSSCPMRVGGRRERAV